MSSSRENLTPDPELVAAWVAFMRAPDGTIEREINEWAFEPVWKMCCTDPEWGWQFVLAVLADKGSADIMRFIAAGPLEDLLNNHPWVVIDRVEAEARRDPRFASLLGGVWQSSIPRKVWDRVIVVWDRRGWDGIPAT